MNASVLGGSTKFFGKIKTGLLRRVGLYLPGGGCLCVACGEKLRFFLPFTGAMISVPSVNTIFDVIGSDVRNYACPKCGSNDRERHLILYAARTVVQERLRDARILHFAPEKHFSSYIRDQVPKLHLKADLYPSAPDVQKIDMLDTGFPDGSFDIVIANHVLEHVDNFGAALSEIRRVLRPEGLAILQTPYSALLSTTFEDAGIESGVAREFAYGQDDHVRLFGKDVFEQISVAGFVSRVASHDAIMGDVDARRYGVNAREPFFLFERV